jgi:hypothetical protein
MQIISLSLTVSDGQSACFDNYFKVNSDYHLPDTRLTRIVTVYHTSDDCINNIILSFADGNSKQLGYDFNKGRVESLVLADNEHVIGAQIEHGTNWVMAVTWITLKRL